MTTFLDQSYATSGANATRALYDAWAASYEAEVAENGYATPGRVASALARSVADKSTPVMDFGCGTGLSGLALRLAGFDVIDGADLSPEMLEIARQKALYRSLTLVNPAKSPFEAGTYPVIAAIGVIGAGAAPIETFDTLMTLLPKGGFFAFSYNDNTLKDPAFEGCVSAWVDPGAACLHVRDYGPHLPARNMKSMIYVLEKL